MKETERTLKALANGRRLAILKHLRKVPEENVGNIAREIHLSLRSTSHHLAILSAAKLVEKEQRSNEVFYKLPQLLKTFIHQILAEP
jgi:DNA-binding transcriptional ArsR family regulator